MKKIINSLVIFIICYVIILNFPSLQDKENLSLLELAIVDNITPSFALLISSIVAGVYLVLVYEGKKEKNLALETQLKKYYLIRLMSESEQKIFERLSEEKQCKFLEIYVEKSSEEVKQNLKDYLGTSCLEISDSTKSFKRFALIFLLLLALVPLNPIQRDYSDYVAAYNLELQKEQEEYNRILEDQMLYLEGLPPIQLMSNNTFKNGDVMKYIDDYIRVQQPFLIDKCQIIHLCSSDVFEILSAQESFTTEETYAYAKSVDMGIYLQMNFTDWDLTTVAHELIHIYDFYHGNDYTFYGISDNPEWQNLYHANPNSITEYGSTNSAEFLAEAGRYYFWDVEYLKVCNMNVYNYMNNMFGLY